jgi:hypothetical protein
MRTPARFTVDVPDIGTFTFRRRTMQDQLLIQAEFAKLSAGIEDLASRMAAEALATLPRIVEQAPPGFDLAELDPLDPEDWAKLGAIYGGLRDAEVKFRGGAAPERQAMGPGDGGHGGVPVAPPLRPATD